MRLQLIGAVVTASMIAAPAVAEPTKSGSPITSDATLGTGYYTDTDHVTVLTPTVAATVQNPTAGWSASASYLVDVVSAASVDIVSTASGRWNEVRQAGTASGSYAPKDVGVHAAVGISSEPDYLSLSGAARLTWDFAEKSHRLTVGYGRTHDTIGRHGTPFSVFSRTLDVDLLTASLAFTLNSSTALSLGSDFYYEHGDQSKPYRYIPMFSAAVAPTIENGASVDEVNQKRLGARPLEQLPLNRTRYALTARFGHRFDHGTLRVDERFYTDSWALHASTTEARYYLDLSRRFTVWPRFRFHAQDSVYFWRRAYVGVYGPGGWELPTLRTGDRELGPLTTVGGGLGGTWNFGGAMRPKSWQLSAAADWMHTAYIDDLYVTSRDAFLATLGVEGVWE
ncbi:MAG TPA: DUF3570 domain-containing protein [Polyangiaceae bacterium]|nr:DUF3570 domain-containing protein [Polyangiaceae bacterium]